MQKLGLGNRQTWRPLPTTSSRPRLWGEGDANAEGNGLWETLSFSVQLQKSWVNNWAQVGITQGRGKLEKSKQGKLPKKYILLYPLLKDFKEQLSQQVTKDTG